MESCDVTDWKPGTRLLDDQSAFPFVWTWDLGMGFDGLAPTAALEIAMGPGKGRKLRSWGHDDDGVHWLATRAGANLHTDRNYARYSHHVIVRNDGWRLRGVDDGRRIMPLMPGVMYCLDTWSPHAIVPDLRLNAKPLYKVQIAVDRDEPLNRVEAEALMRPWFGRSIEDSVHLAKPGPSPRSTVR